MQGYPHRPGKVATSGKVACEAVKDKGPLHPWKNNESCPDKLAKKMKESLAEEAGGWHITGATLEMLHCSGRATAVIILGFHFLRNNNFRKSSQYRQGGAACIKILTVLKKKITNKHSAVSFKAWTPISIYSENSLELSNQC